MRIFHRFAFRATEAQRRELQSFGIKLPAGVAMPGGGDRFVAFEVAEDRENWHQIRTLLNIWGVPQGLVRTEFSTRELDDARWLETGAVHRGYPQPDDDLGYLRVTYDLTEWCQHCGIGKKQKAPFRLKGEPTWAEDGILQLTWIYDELFVKPEVWERVFEPAGVGRTPVLDVGGLKLNTVVQLKIIEDVDVVTTGLAFETCAVCGRVKYLPVTRGAFPPLERQPSHTIARTRTYFGSGGQADRPVLLSHAVAHSLTTLNVGGAVFRPVQSSSRD